MKQFILSLYFTSLFLFISAYASVACAPNIPADITEDCKVDFNDFAMLANDWLKGSSKAEIQWVARYMGQGLAVDTAKAVAIDSNDNIYVTGRSTEYDTTNADYVTIKYSPHSNEAVWVAKYNGPKNSSDYANAIAIDSNDNIYVTGRSTVSGTDYDYATIKYSPDSNQPVWVARYNGPGNGRDVADAIVIDSNDNIYVTGYSTGSGTDRDYATIKYSPGSNEAVWVARYNGPVNGRDQVEAIAIDSNDNIYVTGCSTGSGADYDYATIKYSPDSNQPVWVARYNGPKNSSDYANAIAIDSNDNIYVTGSSTGTVTYNDYATIKYTPDSNQPIWVARYNGPDNSSDYANAIAIDSNDNIYVTGCSVGSGTSCDYTTIKYTPDSNQPIWVARYNDAANSTDKAYAIAIDSNDNIYVTGETGSGWATAYLTIKYSPDSNQSVWVAIYKEADGSEDKAYALAIDSNDNIYVTGYGFWSSTEYDYATIKYSNICTTNVSGDLNNDCKVDIFDLAEIVSHWLECNLDPPESCWE